jgi:hypothetical protein
MYVIIICSGVERRRATGIIVLDSNTAQNTNETAIHRRGVQADQEEWRGTDNPK